jgi:hypothetical protein
MITTFAFAANVLALSREPRVIGASTWLSFVLGSTAAAPC